MQISTVQFQDLNSEFRIDAEYYRSEILDRLNILEKHNKDSLDNLADFVIGPFGSTVTVDKYVDTSDYKYIRNRDINDFAIKADEPALIPKVIYDSLSHFHIKENDLLITVVGTLGKVAIATNADTKSIFSCKSTILRAKGINPFYLLTYLNSNTGRLMSLRGKRGAIQEGLNLSDLKEIPVYIPSEKFQVQIESIIKESFDGTSKSNIFYNQAQSFLLSELGLADWQPGNDLFFIIDYSDAVEAGRIDAEYFQPKYDEIVKAIKSYPSGWDTLGNLVKLRDKNFTPLNKTEYKYIELSNIAGNGEILDCMFEEGQDLPSRARRKVATGDVIVSSIEGSLSSIALIEKEYDEALCSTGFHVIKSEHFNSETLLVLLKSTVGQLQLKKGCSGTILTAINKDEFNKVVLPKVDVNIQSQIQQKVTESFNLRKQSKHLLECAKRAVEIAIEQNEDTAIRFLEEHVTSGCAMINISTEVENEKDENSPKYSRTLADKPYTRGAQTAVSGKHPGAGACLNGVRRRDCKPEDAERVSEESEEYSSTTRFIESSLGIKSYSELAPHLAKGVERVMALLLNKSVAELLITPEFICTLHKDAFEVLFPVWAGQYRDRNVTVGKHMPPPYYEVPLMVRQYCEDLEARLSALGDAPPITNILLEALAVAEGMFLSIHPFLDFNGRVARMLLFALCYRLDLPPVELVPIQKHKEDYLFALSEGDKLNWQPLIEIWKQRLGVRT